jgi:hypothetical protein
LDDLFQQYQFWFQKSSHCLLNTNKLSNNSKAIVIHPGEDIIVEDPLGLEECIYKDIQDSDIIQSSLHENYNLGHLQTNKDSTLKD